MLPIEIFMYVYIFLLGIIIGSFLNVLIYRVPNKENFVTTRSHCMSCGYQLRWYDLVPLFSYLALGGKCRKCKQKISVQYPLIEGLNGILYVLTFLKYGMSIQTLLYCFLFSTLIALSVIDFRTYEIPVGFNWFLLVLGLIRVMTDFEKWSEYGIGFLAISAFLGILYYASKGAAIGGGDVKLMATCGLLLGWKLIVFAFVVGCVLGSVIHVIRMRISHQDHILAMGPYLSGGVAIAVFFGDIFLKWYLGIIGL